MRSVALSTLAATFGCGLFPSLDGLDDARDAAAMDTSSVVDAAAEAAIDAPNPNGAHGGTHVLRADLEGNSPGFSNTWQWVTTTQQQTYQFAVWVRGASSIQILAKDGNWGTNVLT